MKRDSYSDQQAHASFQPRSPQSAIDPTQLGQPTQHSSSTSDMGAKWLNKASGWVADKLQTAQNFVSSGDAISPDQILPALKGTVSPNQPLVGVIDSGFGANEHGSKMVEAIQKENPQAQIWKGGGVGTGNWSESLVEFVDTAKAGGHSRAVANLSFDLTEVHPDGSVSTRTQLTAEEQSALTYARDNGVLVVASSGNQGGAMSALGQASQPSDNLIVVGAANDNDSSGVAQSAIRASYSSYGAGLDLVADVGTAGTSLAAAKVTGAIANIWSANPELSSQQVNQILTTTATDLKAPGRDAETGAGLLNSTGAINLATHTTPEAIVFSGAQLIQPVPESLAGATWESRNGSVASERTNFPIEGDKPRSPARSIPAQRAAKQRAAGQRAFVLHRQGERAPLPPRPAQSTPTPAQRAAGQRAVASPTPAQRANLLHRQGERAPLPPRPAQSTPTPAQRAAGQRAVALRQQRERPPLPARPPAPPTPAQQANLLHRQGERSALPPRPAQSTPTPAQRAAGQRAVGQRANKLHRRGERTPLPPRPTQSNHDHIPGVVATIASRAAGGSLMRPNFPRTTPATGIGAPSYSTRTPSIFYRLNELNFKPTPNRRSTSHQRRQMWLAMADDSKAPLTEVQRQQIRATGGKAPTWYNPVTRRIERMELAHEPKPFRSGGTEVTPRWTEDHAARDPHRHLSPPVREAYQNQGDAIREAFARDVVQNEWGYTVDQPHPSAVENSSVARGVGRVLSRIAAPIGAVIDGVQLKNAYDQDGGFGENFQRTAGSVAASWGGAAAGAAIGTAIAPGIGTVIGGVAGAIAGSEIGDDIVVGAKQVWKSIFG